MICIKKLRQGWTVFTHNCKFCWEDPCVCDKDYRSKSIDSLIHFRKIIQAEINRRKKKHTAELCPFCGGDDLEIQHGNEDREGVPVNIVCTECGARGPIVYMTANTVLSDVNYCAEKTGWNKRV